MGCVFLRTGELLRHERNMSPIDDEKSNSAFLYQRLKCLDNNYSAFFCPARVAFRHCDYLSSTNGHTLRFQRRHITACIASTACKQRCHPRAILQKLSAGALTRPANKDEI
jgi:hypothetical protein